MELKTTILQSEITERVCNATDYPMTNEIITQIPDFKVPEEDFGIGLIVGPSGSGKSTILRKFFGETPAPMWDKEHAVCDHFNTYDDARESLGAVALNSIPAWLRPYHTLSNGEQYRADLARQLRGNCVIDEFTSVVDRNVAKSCATALSKYVKRTGKKGIVLASCHYDIVDWLEPDWVFDCLTGEFGRCHRRPEVNIELYPSKSEAWSIFSKHHYLTANINKSARCWIAVWGDTIVGFASSIAHPSGTIKNAWREHRTVVLPEFQGMGFGSKISDAVATIFTGQGYRYFSKTAHPNFGEYREASAQWKPTSKNKKKRPDYNHDRVTKESAYAYKHVDRLCYSHEFIGK